MSSWEEATLDALQLLPLASEELPPATIVWRALYVPTFHRDCVVEVRRDGERGQGGEILVVAAGSGLRDWLMSQAGVLGPRPGRAEPFPGALTLESAPLDGSKLAAFESTMGGLSLFTLDDMPADNGRDGMPLLGEVRDGARCCCFTAWSPVAREHPRHHAYFAALARLAVSTLPAAPGRAAIEACLGYL
jgi:hypothetical protein